MFKFYDRENELELLSKIRQNSSKNAQMPFMLGRRRIGKTTLLTKAYKKTTTLYFFVAKK
ncbi:MAG: hypothetical protein LBG23_02085 [Endomicrobium sp.]|nr:hypothetical protein [Endomicrobium sp.]